MTSIRIEIKEDKIDINADGRVNEYPRFKGFVQVAELLNYAGYEISCLLLTADDMLKVWDTEKRMSRAKIIHNPEDGKEEEYHTFDSMPDNPIMDNIYYNDLKKEANRLISDIATAEEYNDIGKAETLKDELEEVKKHLLRMTKPDGQSKKLPDEFTKPLDSVRKAITKALEMIGEKDRELMLHLKKQIRIGRYCCYHSLPSVEVRVKLNVQNDNKISG